MSVNYFVDQIFNLFLFKEWIDEYKNRYADNGLLKKEIDDYMKTYDESKEMVNHFWVYVTLGPTQTYQIRSYLK